jgi:brefeldin A-inhibited guanine nucleotide-exchange protein
MHAFVDMLEFRELDFVDALRLFLQSFRLPGEAQKIDRYMLKFAERYIAGNSQTPLANAGQSYICLVFGSCAHSWSKTPHMSWHIP